MVCARRREGKSKGGPERGPSEAGPGGRADFARTTERGFLGGAERVPENDADLSVTQSPRDGMGEDSTISAVASRPQTLAFVDSGRRQLQPPPADLTMHSDAADVGYGGTLGTCSGAGSPGLWKGHGLWAAKERAEPITLRELKAVRVMLPL
jgi:hypothetical protein